MNKEIKYHIKNLKIEKQNYIINKDGSIIIIELIIPIEKIKDTCPPPPKPNKTKHKHDKNKLNGKRMTEQRVRNIFSEEIKKQNIPSEKRVEELINKAIEKKKIPNEDRVRVIVNEEFDKAIERKKIPNEDRVREIVNDAIVNNNVVLIQAVQDIVRKEITKAITPINDKLDKVIKLNKLKTK